MKRRVGFAILLVLANGSPAAAQFLFYEPISYEAGADIRDLALADLNGDDRLDVVAADAGDSTVVVLLGTDHGPGIPTAFSAGGSPNALIVTDLDDDEILDVAVTLRTMSRIAILKGLGAGAFDQPILHTVGLSPTDLAAADLNQDGHVDLAMVLELEDRVAILHGTASGGFSNPFAFRAGNDPHQLEAGDFNWDGVSDLVVGNASSDPLCFLYNFGDGYLFTPRFLEMASSPPLAVADLNHDQRLDLAFDPGQVIIVQEIGFDVRQRLGPGNAADMEFGDLNGDTHPDYVGATQDGQFLVAFGLGDGNFDRLGTYRCGPTPQAISIGDLTGDAIPDVVTANGASGKISVTPGQGGSLFAQALYAVGASADASVAVDLNGDGAPDLAVANPSGGAVSILMNDGAGAFSDGVAYPSAPPLAIAAGDLDQDGHADIAVAVGDRVQILRGAGDGTLLDAADLPASAGSRALAIGFMNGDGFLDLCALQNDDEVAVHLGLGGGTFAPPLVLDTQEHLIAFELIDLNGDQTLDVAASTDTIPSVLLITNSGTGVLTRVGRLPTTDVPGAISGGDTNGDAIVDLAVAIPTLLQVMVWIGEEDGDFGSPRSFATEADPIDLALADIDRYAPPPAGGLESPAGPFQDVIIVNHESRSLTILLRRGPAGPDPYFSTRVVVGFDPTALTVADFNRDGVPDIAVSRALGTMVVLTNLGIPAPVPVELAEFAAEVHDRTVTLRWRTGLETGILGFHVRRGSTAEPSAARIVSPEMIIAGAGTYTFIDRDLVPGSYHYWLEEVTRGGERPLHGPIAVSVLASPPLNELAQNVPNPFRDFTVIPVSTLIPGPMRLSIYDPKGRLVRRLLDSEHLDAGRRGVPWDGTDDRGTALPSGAYFCHLEAAGRRSVMKLVVLR